LLSFGKAHGRAKLEQTVERALALGSCDVAAVRHLLTVETLERPRCEAVELGDLVRYERPLPLMNDYDQLLAGGLR
jgi:hypothetical protein